MVFIVFLIDSWGLSAVVCELTQSVCGAECCTIYANEANINYSVECIDSQVLHSYRFEMTSRVYSSGCIDSGLNFRVYNAGCIEFWDEPSCMY